MNKSFYNDNEEKDFEMLTLFNEKLNIKELGATPRKWYYDASGYTNIKTSEVVEERKYVEIELKNRNGKYDNQSAVQLKNKWGKYYTTNTIFIEPQHYSRMVDDFRFDGVVPLYVNFMNDDGMILVWNLSTLKKKPDWEYVPKINDKGAEREKGEWRVLLPIVEAYVYDKDYNLIKKPE